MPRRLRFPFLLAACTLSLVAGADSAAATTRYIKPGGLTSGACTTLATACRYDRVFAGAGSNAGDSVSVLGGTYDVTAAPAVVNRKLLIAGLARARPRFYSSAYSEATLKLDYGADDTTVRHLEVEAQGTDSPALMAKIRTQVRDLRLDSLSACAVLQQADSSIDATTAVLGGISGGTCITAAAGAKLRGLTVTATTGLAVNFGGPGSALEDSQVTSQGNKGVRFSGGGASGAAIRRSVVHARDEAIDAITGPSVITDTVAVSTNATAIRSTGPLQLRNVTAVGSTSGIEAGPLAGPPPPVAGAIEAKNVIARGNVTDIVAKPGFSPCDIPPCPAGAVTIDHSNFRTRSGAVTDAGNNQSGDPLFNGPDDFRLRLGSPAIDAGTADALNGTTDLDGKPRALGAAPDIGAYESTPGVAPPPPVTLGGAAGDTTAPSLAGVSLTNKVFAVAKQATALAARKKAKKGTKVHFTLTEAATVALRIDRAAAGRRSKSKCVKPTKKRRHARKCTRYLKVGTLTRSAVAGPNSVSFSGRIGKKALRPGRYRITLVATDPAGNRSPVKQLKFRVVKR